MINPCDKCIVRSMCQEPCYKFESFIRQNIIEGNRRCARLTICQCVMHGRASVKGNTIVRYDSITICAHLEDGD